MAIAEFNPAINCEITGAKEVSAEQGQRGMDITFYGLKSCDTCRKAQQALTAAGHDLTVIDVRADGVPQHVLSHGLDLFGDALINRRSTTWRGLSDVDRFQKPLDLLTEHPTLMKRPLILAGEKTYLGWGKDVESALTY